MAAGGHGPRSQTSVCSRVAEFGIGARSATLRSLTQSAEFGAV